MPKFGTEDVLFGYFWGKLWKKLLPYLKSATSNLSKVCKLTKLHQLGPKMRYFDVFLVEF